MSLIVEKWIHCTKCKERWKPKDQSINEGDQMIHICNYEKQDKNVTEEGE